MGIEYLTYPTRYEPPSAYVESVKILSEKEIMERYYPGDGRGYEPRPQCIYKIGEGMELTPYKVEEITEVYTEKVQKEKVVGYKLKKENGK